MKVIISKRFILSAFFLLFLILPANGELFAEVKVYFNLESHKVHKMGCHWGKRCTKNCIVIPRSKAYKQGGVGCKICGG